LTAVRVLLTCGAAAGFAGMALSHEESLTMAIGMTPIALLAVEGI
jgi:hypothetical protein